jgi:hypothetical protein
MLTRNRILCYLFLALFCYTLASILTTSYSVFIFVVVGFVAEILFWFNISRSNDAKTKTPS